MPPQSGKPSSDNQAQYDPNVFLDTLKQIHEQGIKKRIAMADQQAKQQELNRLAHESSTIDDWDLEELHTRIETWLTRVAEKPRAPQKLFVLKDGQEVRLGYVRSACQNLSARYPFCRVRIAKMGTDWTDATYVPLNELQPILSVYGIYLTPPELNPSLIIKLPMATSTQKESVVVNLVPIRRSERQVQQPERLKMLADTSKIYKSTSKIKM